MDRYQSLSHSQDARSRAQDVADSAKLAVSPVVGYIKGKRAIHLAGGYAERKRNVVGRHFWARGYFVSTVGRDGAEVREDVRNQEKEDDRLDQLQLLR